MSHENMSHENMSHENMSHEKKSYENMSYENRFYEKMSYVQPHCSLTTSETPELDLVVTGSTSYKLHLKCAYFHIYYPK